MQTDGDKCRQSGRHTGWIRWTVKRTSAHRQGSQEGDRDEYSKIVSTDKQGRTHRNMSRQTMG